MEESIATTTPQPFLGEDWFDPLEAAVRGRIRGFIEELLEAELEVALQRGRYDRRGAARGHRHGHRERHLIGTFGPVTVSVPRARLVAADAKTLEWRNQTLPAYKRLTKRAEMLIASAYLAGTNTRRVRRALGALFGGAIGKDVVSRAWHKVQTDWEAWQKRDLSHDDIVRLVLDGTVVRVRLDKKATSLSVLVALGVRRDGQKVLLALRNMGGESEAAWRALLDDLVARGLATPELVIVDGAAGLEKAVAALWNEVPVQRCTVHKHRNLLAHAPKKLYDEVSADYTDMIYAKTAMEVDAKRKAFLRKWRLRCPRSLPAWKRLARSSSPSCASPTTSGNPSGLPTPSSGCMRNSSAASRPNACCPAPRPPACCSGRCWPAARSPSAKSTAGRPFMSPLPSNYLIWPLEPVT